MNQKVTKSPRIGFFCMLCSLVTGVVVNGILTNDAPSHEPATAQIYRDGGVEIANLQDQLTFGLRARLPRERAFIKFVVAKVEAGDLPVELVLSTFHWARHKRPYPFPYFEHALRLRAARYDIIL